MSNQPAGDRKKIVLVNDEPNVLRALRRELTPWSRECAVDIVTADSGHTALELLNEIHETVSVIVFDMRMPDMQGSDLLLAVKEQHPEIMLLLLLTAHTNTEQLLKAIGAGVHAFLLKPWDGEYLRGELSKALQVYRLRERNELVERRIREELEAGGNLQRTLFELPVHSTPLISFSVSSLPVRELRCGGDYYDILPRGNDRYLVLMGDVAGHGIKAAFVTIILKSLIGGDSEGAPPDADPSAFLSWLNERVCRQLSRAPDMLITFCAVQLDLGAGRLDYAHAGHLPILVARGAKLTQLRTEGPPIGLATGATYLQDSVSIKPGDRLVLFTDGLIEVGSASTEEGLARLEDVVVTCSESAAGSPAAMGDCRRDLADFSSCVVHEVERRAAAAYDDDVTVLSVELMTPTEVDAR